MYGYPVILYYISINLPVIFISFINSFVKRAIYKTLCPELVVQITWPTRDNILLMAGWLCSFHYKNVASKFMPFDCVSNCYLLFLSLSSVLHWFLPFCSSTFTICIFFHLATFLCTCYSDHSLKDYGSIWRTTIDTNPENICMFSLLLASFLSHSK